MNRRKSVIIDSEEKVRSIISLFRTRVLNVREIAKMYGISRRHVYRIVRKYEEKIKRNERIEINKRGRKRRRVREEEIDTIVRVANKYKGSLVHIGREIREKYNIAIGQNKLYSLIKEMDMNNGKSIRKGRYKWIRYEATYSNDIWHTDFFYVGKFKYFGKYKWFIAYLDDKSRFIVSYKLSKEATEEVAINALKEGINKYGKPVSILTDRGSQFISNKASNKGIYGINKFQKYLIKEGINHIISRVNHPQTNGKIERFFRTIITYMKWFIRKRDGGDYSRYSYNGKVFDMDAFIEWYNYERPHMSLDNKTPYEVYVNSFKEGSKVLRW